VRDIVNVGYGAVASAHRHVVQVLDLRRTRVELDEIFQRPDLFSARRQYQILLADGVDHVVGRQGVCAERLRVEIHLNLALLPP